MAAYTDLYSKLSDDDLRNRVSVAVVVSAHALLVNTPTTDQQKWAADVFANPKLWGDRALMGVLAANSSATIAQIDAASDAAVQSAVDDLTDALVVAYNAG